MISALMELMHHTCQSGDFTLLATVARTLLDAVPDDIVSAQVLAVAYLKTGRQGEAMQLFERLRSRLPALKRRNAANASLQSAQAVCLSEATDRNPDYAGTWRTLAGELMQLGRNDEAVAMLRLAIAARPDDLESLRELGRLGLAMADPDIAEEGYRALLAHCPGDAAAASGLARVLEVRLAQRHALSRVSSAADLHPEGDNAWQPSTKSRPATSTAATLPSATTPGGSC